MLASMRKHTTTEAYNHQLDKVLTNGNNPANVSLSIMIPYQINYHKLAVYFGKYDLKPYIMPLKIQQREITQ